jgi:hypothetical protein
MLHGLREPTHLEDIGIIRLDLIRLSRVETRLPEGEEGEA